MTSVPERAAPQVVVAGIWQLGTDLVLVRSPEDPGRWRLPGGAVRPGELLAEAIVRGTADDTGADALCGPFVGWGEVVQGDGALRLTMYFELVVLDPPTVEPRSGAMPDGPGGAQVRCTPDWEVSELPVVDGLAEFLADQGLIELVV